MPSVDKILEHLNDEPIDYGKRVGVEGYTWCNMWTDNSWPEKGEPYQCPKCHTTRLECLSTDFYETSIRCPDCKVWTVVHDD